MELISRSPRGEKLIKELLEQLRQIKSQGSTTASVRDSCGYLWTFAAQSPESGYEFDPIRIPNPSIDNRTGTNNDDDYGLPSIKYWKWAFLEKLQVSLNEGRVSCELIDISGKRKKRNATHSKSTSPRMSLPGKSNGAESISCLQSTTEGLIQPETSTMDPQRLAADFQARMAQMLERSLAEQAQDLKQAWNRTHSGAVERLESKLQEAEAMIKELQGHARESELETSTFQERLLTAKEEAKNAARNAAAEEMKRELAELHRRNLDHIARVREKHDKEIAVARLEFRRCVEGIRERGYKEGFKDGQAEVQRQSNVQHAYQAQTPERSVSDASFFDSLDDRQFAIGRSQSVERTQLATFGTPEQPLGTGTQGESPTSDADIKPPQDAGEPPGLLSHQPTAYLSALNALGPHMLSSHKIIPRTVQSFSDEFIRETIGGARATFARVSPTMIRKQVVPWPALIRVNPEHHEFAPKLCNDYGALTLVEGRFTEDKDPCNTGSTLPVVVKEAKHAFQYIGHYTIVRWTRISIEEWKSWPKQRRDGIVQEMRSKWGSEVMLRNGLQLRDDWPHSTPDQIHGFFERETEPNLRMCLAILKFHSFNQKDYDILTSEATRRRRKEKETAAPSPFSRAQFEFAFTKWMGNFHWEPHRKFPSAAVGLRKQVSATVLQRGEDAKMFGQEYQMGNPNTQFKHFIWELALELSAKFPLGTMRGDDDVIRFLSDVAEMFDDHNKNKLSKMTGTAAGCLSKPHTLTNNALPKTAQHQEMPSRKRQRIDDCSGNTSKQPCLNPRIPKHQLTQAQPRDFLLNDEIVPHAVIMNSLNARDCGRNGVTLSGLVRAKNLDVARARERILRHWSEPLAGSWISRNHSVRFLGAVCPVAATMSFEKAVRQINCAIIRRLRQKNNKNVLQTPNPTLADFQTIVKSHHTQPVLSPQLLAEFGLRHGPEGFLEHDTTRTAPRIKRDGGYRSVPQGSLVHRDSEGLYDASPRR